MLAFALLGLVAGCAMVWRAIWRARTADRGRSDLWICRAWSADFKRPKGDVADMVQDQSSFTPDHREHIVKPHRDYEIYKYGFT